jgi:hypothetical protein
VALRILITAKNGNKKEEFWIITFLINIEIEKILILNIDIRLMMSILGQQSGKESLIDVYTY